MAGAGAQDRADPPTPALRPTIIDMCRYESQNTRSGRESTQDHPNMSQHAWNCLELNGIARGCLDFFFSASYEIQE